jgi:hypothetical protein
LAIDAPRTRSLKTREGIEETLNMASNTSCTDAAQSLGRMAPLMKMRERPAAKSIAAPFDHLSY